jgi:hypothetical protein
MNEISDIDQALLNRVKKRIEQHSGLSGDAELSQKDFDFLLFYIQEKTGQGLSLTTLKRIWRNEFQRLPHLSTLNMLAMLAYGKDWHALKKEFLEERAPNSIEEKEPDTPVHTELTIPTNRPRKVNVKLICAVAVALLLVLFFGKSWYDASSAPLGNINTVQFSAVPTADRRIPNSVVFSYDLTGIKASHFYIQQSWDSAKRVEISPENKKQTDIYYEPGYHYAKLLANNRIIKETAVHIQCDDWYVRFRYPNSELVKVNDTDLHTQGYLGLSDEYVSKRFHPPTDKFQLGYMLSKDFDLPADEFQIQASVKFDSVHIPVCPTLHLLIKGDRDYSWVTLGNKGCESNLGLKVGDTHVSGKTNDLSLLGIDVFSWQKIKVTLTRGTFRLSINDRVVHEGSYSNSLGDLKEIDFFFNGIGSIDDISIEDHQRRSLLSQRF